MGSPAALVAAQASLRLHYIIQRCAYDRHRLKGIATDGSIYPTSDLNRRAAFAIEIAQPQNLEAVEGEAGSALASARNLADIADGPVIYIEVKMGRKKGSLAKQSIDDILNYFRTGDGHSQDVRKLCATTSNEDGSEVVNFLKDFLREVRDIEVPEGDPEGHYTRRQSCLASCFQTHFSYIQEVYGTSAVTQP